MQVLYFSHIIITCTGKCLPLFNPTETKQFLDARLVLKHNYVEVSPSCIIQKDHNILINVSCSTTVIFTYYKVLK